MRRNALSWGVLAVAVSIAGCSQESQKRVPAGQAAAKPGTIGTGGAGATLSDDEFVRDVALKNMSDVELSRIALNRAANPEVRSFAQRMVEDHSAINQALESFVSRQSFDWPAQLDEKHRQAVDELQGKLGSDFQVGYLKAMIEAHQDLAAKLESRLDVQSLADWKTAVAARTRSKELPEPSTSLRDAQVRPNSSNDEFTTKINQWAAESYPTVQKHLDTARALESAIKR